VNEKNEDRRIRKTKKALRESLIILMAEKNIRDISVQELSDLADLNRATFYLHYKDIYELQQQIEDEVVVEINTILDRHMPTILNRHMPTVSGQKHHPLFVALLSYIEENARLCNMLFSENSNRSFLDKLCTIIEERCLRSWLEDSRLSKTEEELSYFTSYVVYGYVAAIAKWVRTGMQSPPEKLAEMMSNMGLYGIGFLEKL